MPKCLQCGKRSVFLSVNERGLCQNCAASNTRKRSASDRVTSNAAKKSAPSSERGSDSRETIVLDWLAEEDLYVCRDLIENENCPVYILRHYEKETWRSTKENYPFSDLETSLCLNRNTSPSYLSNFYSNTTKSRWPVAKNPSTPESVLEDIFEKGRLALRNDSDPVAVRALEFLAENPRIRPEWRRFFLSPDCDNFNVKDFIARNPATSESELIQLINTESERGGGNLGAIVLCLANPNLSRKAALSNGFRGHAETIIKVHVGANPNLTESDLLAILECLSVLNGKTVEEKIQMLKSNPYHILDDGLRETIDSVILNPAATETVHRKIIGACREALNTNSDPYHYSMGFCTEKAPSAIIETLARDYGIDSAVQRVGAPKALLEEYFHTEGKFGPWTRRFAIRNPDFPKLFLSEPEKDSYIKRMADRHVQNSSR